MKEVVSEYLSSAGFNTPKGLRHFALPTERSPTTVRMISRLGFDALRSRLSQDFVPKRNKPESGLESKPEVKEERK